MRPRLWPALRPVLRPGHAVRPAAVVAMLLWVAACSMPAQLGSFFSRDDRADTTASISGWIAPAAFSSTDLAAASAAAAVLLEHDGSTSGPWENPLTGARGTITPLATSYRDGGIECHDFLASYVREKAEAWMQGEACRNGFGRWEVRDFKPWRR